MSSQCGPAATTFAALPASGGSQRSQTTVAVNSTALFWLQQGSNTIMSASTTGGAAQPVVTDSSSCGPSSFAVDENNLYYWSNGSTFGGPAPVIGGLTQVSLATDTPTVLVPNSNTSKGNSCGALTVGKKNVYFETNSQNGPSMNATVYGVPIGGGTATTLGTMPSNGSSAVAVNSTSVILEFSNNGTEQFELLPVDGGSPRMLPVNVNTQGFNGFTADDANIYVVGSGCGCCSCSNASISGRPPSGTVAKIPLDGGPQTILARFSGEAGAIAATANDVYWSTDATVWKVPISGGASIPLSGNLTAGTAAVVCTGGCGSGSNGTTNTIAVDATSVYIADANPAVNAILKVPN